MSWKQGFYRLSSGKGDEEAVNNLLDSIRPRSSPEEAAEIVVRSILSKPFSEEGGASIRKGKK